VWLLSEEVAPTGVGSAIQEGEWCRRRESAPRVPNRAQKHPENGECVPWVFPSRPEMRAEPPKTSASSSPPEDLLVARIGRLERGVDFVGPAEDVQEVLRDKRRAIVAHDRRKLA